MIGRMPDRAKKLNELLYESDTSAMTNFRMDMNTFLRLSYVLQDAGGLFDTKYVTVHEQVAMFLAVLSHHKKNRIIGFDYVRSGETVSKYVNSVMKALMKIHPLLLSSPTPIIEDCNVPRWSCFPGCIGALDGTYVEMRVRLSDQPRYRSRKGMVATNVLAACDTNMLFTYALAGWEGSAADGRVLKDAITRPNGLKVPAGNNYLCDNGYTNGEGFLTLYRGVRYHLKEWGDRRRIPQNYQK
ncbi:PREDICTED: uncharacterized protein LOC105964429 isoform X1 [Erythranthe guttata]|uniref:uncharacterized protein LOC105964429 isoform X1 n=1 Tax=Erythranthe guttata TaxID=4155 RepID=UPI00064DBEA0|nr:PREDICTED: uncharacterized protein LOC105964429 isoform X1 [Erythranthe guttata]|eukprot:XP_012844392.1 PREDICTED: uncharacterized protein LOC105964429 isoform X1 [Erythranthe guttata]